MLLICKSTRPLGLLKGYNGKHQHPSRVIEVQIKATEKKISAGHLTKQGSEDQMAKVLGCGEKSENRLST
jgi:hypothetical protein